MPRRYWLVKSEPDVFSFDDLKNAPDKTTCWDGVRNYQARNFMRDEMKTGDGVLFYHSNSEPPGVAGIAKVAREAYPDPTQFDKKSDYYDDKAAEDAPRWFMVDVRYDKSLKKFVSLDELRANKKLARMRLLQRGNRLSVLPVTEAEWREILKMSGIG